MPEGDTIFRAATVLRRALVGKPIESFRTPRLRTRPVAPGTRVRSVDTRGKHLLIAFDDGRVLHTHQQMSGAWHVYAPGDRWRRPRHQARVVLAVPGAEAVCFASPVVELMDERELPRHPVLAALGPDLAQPQVDVEEILARLARLPSETPISVALLDQRVASGVGNVYKSEVLFACRVDPFAPVGSLASDTRRRLYETASRLLRRNLEGGPRVTAPGGLAVYRKRGRPCPRCATPISAGRQGEAARMTYWCSTCAPPGRSAAANGELR